MAVITTEGRNELTALYVAMYNVAPGSTALSEMVAAAESGKTLLQIATELATRAGFSASFPGFLTGQEFADRLVSRMLPSTTPAAAITWATNWVLSALNAGKSRAQVISEAVVALRATANVNYADAKTQLANKVDVSLYYAITKGAAADSATAIDEVTASAASVTSEKTEIDEGVTGANFSLTTGTDALVGDAGNNVFNGVATTITAGDKIDGGAGTADKAILDVTGTAASFTLTNVEIVDFQATPNPATVNLNGSTGITAINNTSSANGATLTVTNVGNVVNSTLTGGQAATTITYTTAAVAGTSDSSTLTLAGTNAGAAYTANGVETISIVSGTSANTLTSLTDDKLATLNISGDKDLTIGTAVGGATIATVNAASATGNITLTTGAGAGGANSTGVTVTGPTATGSINVTTGANKDTVTLGSGNNTVNTGAGNDTITAGTGTNTITPGAGNDSITLTGTKDTIRFADAGATNADTITGFSSSTVLALNMGAAQAGTTAASAGTFGVVSGTTAVLPGVGGTGTGTATVLQAVNPNATATVGTVAAGSTVVTLNGAFTDGTAAGVVTALGTTATTGITTTATGKFVLVTYSVGNIAQVWSYGGDTTANGDIDSAELSLVATLSGVAQNSLTAANFSSYLTPAASTTTVSNEGQTINLTTPLNVVQSSANANGHFLSAANDTVNVGIGMLPTTTATATAGLTVIDPSSTDADVLNATVLSADWNLGTIVSAIETVNLTMLAADTNGFIQSAILPGTTTLNVLGSQSLTVSGGVLSGNAYGLGAGYTGTLSVAVPTNPTAALTLNLNGTAGTSAATSPTFDITGGVVTALTVNANANTTLNMDFNTTEAATITLNGAGNVTVFGTSANFGAANVNAVSPAYTGSLTFRPSDVASMDFSATGVVNGLKGLDFTDIAANAVTGVTYTQPAATGGNTLTITDAPTTARQSSIEDLTVVQLGGTLNDTVNFVFGSSVSATTGGALVAATTENVNISYSPTTAGTAMTFTAVTTAAGAIGTQTVKVSGTGAFTLGTVTADNLDTSGVASTGSVLATTLANGASGAIFTGGASKEVITGTANIDNLSMGAGADTVTSAGGADTISLGASDGSADTVVTTTGAAYTTAAADVVSDFTAGASGDILQIDISDSTAITNLGIVAAGDGATAIAGDLVIKTHTAGTATTLAATDEIVVVSGTFANSAALLTSIGGAAGITKSAANTATNGLLVVWSDGTNTHVSAVSDAGNDAAMTTADLELTDLVVLTGVITGFNTVNFTAVA